MSGSQWVDEDNSVEPCGHGVPGDHPVCAACGILRSHARWQKFGSSTDWAKWERCECWMCRGIRWAESQPPPWDDRIRNLGDIAELAMLEALQVYDAAGIDTTAVGIILRQYEFFPHYSAEDPDAREHELQTMSYAEYLRTPEWAEQRRRARLRAGDRCQGCDTPDNLEVHHRTYERRGVEEPGDLTVLCAGCHTAVHLIADGRRGKIRSESRRART